jgi:hypothetical protein
MLINASEDPSVKIYLIDPEFQSSIPLLRNKHLQPLLVNDIPISLLLATSTWAESKESPSGYLPGELHAPQGLSWWMVNDLLTWLKRAGTAMGPEPKEWSEEYKTSCYSKTWSAVEIH